MLYVLIFFFSSRRRHTRYWRDWSSDVCSSDLVSGAYQAEVFRGAFQVVSRGEIEAARSVGMHRWLMFRRIIAPQVLRYRSEERRVGKECRSRWSPYH